MDRVAREVADIDNGYLEGVAGFEDNPVMDDIQHHDLGMDRVASSKSTAESRPAEYDIDQGDQYTARGEADAVRDDLQEWKAACQLEKCASLKVQAVVRAAKDRTATADKRCSVVAVAQEDAA